MEFHMYSVFKHAHARHLTTVLVMLVANVKKLSVFPIFERGNCGSFKVAAVEQ